MAYVLRAFLCSLQNSLLSRDLDKKSTPRCGRCAASHHDEKNCPASTYPFKQKCILCGGPHPAQIRTCPVGSRPRHGNWVPNLLQIVGTGKPTDLGTNPLPEFVCRVHMGTRRCPLWSAWVIRIPVSTRQPKCHYPRLPVQRKNKMRKKNLQ